MGLPSLPMLAVVIILLLLATLMATDSDRGSCDGSQ
jgi:hypothetical protein